MHPLRETIKISGKRERGGPGGRHDGRCRALICNSWFGIRNVIARAKPRSRHSSLRFPFRNICVLFESRLSVTFYPSLPLVFLSSTPFLSSLITCPSTFLVIFHSSLALAFIFFFSLPSLCPRFSILVLESTGAHSRHARKISKRRIRGEDEGTYIDTYSHPFLRALRLFTAGAEGTRLRAYVRAKSVSKICTKVAPMGGRREQRRHAAKAKICARSRYVLASIVRNFDGRERKREIDNAIENELNAYQRSNFIFPSSGISITHVY